ncbi:hypothetical protein ABZS66_11015 [Dactylosporangium sp. NPDC005572]
MPEDHAVALIGTDDRVKAVMRAQGPRGRELLALLTEARRQRSAAG